MNEQANMTMSNAHKAILELLGGQTKKARFTTEIFATLQRKKFAAETIEEALAELEAQGLVIIRDNFCADPHLAGVDLRVVALVQSSAGADPLIGAIREIDQAWEKWLSKYLANHRCG